MTQTPQRTHFQTKLFSVGQHSKFEQLEYVAKSQWGYLPTYCKNTKD